VAVLLSLGGVACGRALPADTPAATGPVETGAFEEPAGEEGGIKGMATGAPHDYLVAVGDALAAEDPTVKLVVDDAEPDFEALCAGRTDVLAATGDADEEICKGAVGFHVADAGSEPVVFYVNRDSILRFEVEGLIQFVVDNGEELPAGAGLDPLSIDELQDTQTKLEQVIAGVG
jgi:ABC-type amino acid transport substrate-binding protein